MGGQAGLPGDSRLERALTAKINALDSSYQGGGGIFFVTHSGRVRLSELKQALRTGREQDPLESSGTDDPVNEICRSLSLKFPSTLHSRSCYGHELEVFPLADFEGRRNATK